MRGKLLVAKAASVGFFSNMVPGGKMRCMSGYGGDTASLIILFVWLPKCRPGKKKAFAHCLRTFVVFFERELLSKTVMVPFSLNP